MESDFTKDKVFWTKKMNLSLAKFMEDKPYIWNTKHSKYPNISLRDETFANFADKYHGLGWQAVKERWTNIRSTYGFYMRKIQNKRAMGEEFKVNWFMWEPCKYLYKVHKFAKNTQNGHDSNKIEDANDIVDNDTTQNYSDSDDEYLATTARRTNATCEEIVQNICTVFRDIQDNRILPDTSQYAEVGEAVAEKLSQLNSYEAARVSQKILEILAEYDENNPMNPNNA